jgi:hypothetical protein
MPQDRKNKPEKDKEFNDVLKRMLNTPPTPHNIKKKKPAK